MGGLFGAALLHGSGAFVPTKGNAIDMKSKTFFVASAILMLIPLTASSQELRGDALVKAVNGQALSCTMDNGTKVPMTFARTKPGSTVFPFRAKVDGRQIKGAYVLRKNGSFRNKSSNQSRKITRKKNGALRISGHGIPSLTCLAR